MEADHEPARGLAWACAWLHTATVGRARSSELVERFLPPAYRALRAFYVLLAAATALGIAGLFMGYWWALFAAVGSIALLALGCRWYLRALASRVARQEGLVFDYRDYRDAPWRQKGGWAYRLRLYYTVMFALLVLMLILAFLLVRP